MPIVVFSFDVGSKSGPGMARDEEGERAGRGREERKEVEGERTGAGEKEKGGERRERERRGGGSEWTEAGG